MNELIQSFLGTIAAEAYAVFDKFIKSTLSNALNIENYLDGLLSVTALSAVYNFIYIFSCTLLALKFMQRGFNIYIMWRDGDADSSPKDMVMGAVQAVAVSACFPFLYGVLVDIITWFYSSLLSILKLDLSGSSVTLSNIAGLSLINLIIVIIFFIMALILWLQTIKRGFELLVLRMGLPIACIGLINSDGGVFKSYISTIFKTVITLVVQSILMSVAFRLTTSLDIGGMMIGIAALMAAYSVPVLFQQFLVHGGSSNISGKVYNTVRIIQMVKGLK